MGKYRKKPYEKNTVLEYGMFPTPSPKDKNRKVFHPRPVNSQCVDAKQFIGIIEDRISNARFGNLLGDLVIMRYEFIQALLRGQSVSLPGIGTFRITLRAEQVEHPEDIRADKVSIKGLSFVPEKELMEEIKGRTILSLSHKGETLKKMPDEQQARKILQDFVAEKPENHCSFTRSWFQYRTHMSKNMAYKVLDLLVSKGLLTKEGPRYAPYYIVKGDS